MKIELKNIKHAAFASRETDCFSASVYIDGKLAGTVENDGQGGPNNYHGGNLCVALTMHAKTLPPYEFDGHSVEKSADCVINELLSAHLTTAKLKRLCAKKTVFRLAGETYPEGEYLVIGQKFTPEIRAAVAKRHGDVVFLNETI